MSTPQVTPWNVLSNAISKRVGEARDKHNKAESQERQNEMDIIMAGVQSHVQAGTITDEMLEQAKAKMQKLVPKESVPIVEAWHKTMGALGRHKKQQGNQGKGGGEQPQAQAQAPPGNTPGGPTAAPSGSPDQTPTQAPPARPAPPPTPPPTFPTASQMGTAAGQQEVAKEGELAKGRLGTLKALRNSYKEQGKELPKETDEALTMWTATGQMPSAAMTRAKMHPVSVIGPDNVSLVPGMEDEHGNVWANGQIVEDPKVMPKWKPRRGYAKDGAGKFFSFAIDPQTNQPVPGSEDYQELPPAAYLEHVRENEYHWTDDSGNVHASPFTTSSFTKVPSNMQGKATPAVPPAFAKMPDSKNKTNGNGNGNTGKGTAGTGTSKGTSKGAAKSGGHTLGTKDTGVLSPAGQKAMMITEPVANQARKLVKIIEDAGLKDNDQAGYLLLPYIAYRMGYATDGALESEIAGLSLGSVIEAASVLQGTSRSISALRMAMVHTPNAKLDSPKQIYNKLHNDIIPRLDDVMDSAKKYGRKRATADASAVPDSIKSPPGKSADAEADKWLAAHGK